MKYQSKPAESFPEPCQSLSESALSQDATYFKIWVNYFKSSRSPIKIVTRSTNHIFIHHNSLNSSSKVTGRVVEPDHTLQHCRYSSLKSLCD